MIGRRIRRWTARCAAGVALLGAGAAVGLVAGEVLVRLLAPQQLILLRSDIWVGVENLGWQMRPDIDTTVNTGEREVRLMTDEFGHRIGAKGSSKAEVRILALGDSFLAALQVDHAETMTALMEERLEHEMGRGVEVVNTGVGGWGPSHYLLKAAEQLKRRAYDAVVVFLFVGNDVERGRTSAFPPKEADIRHRLRFPRKASFEEVVDSLLYPVNDILETRSHLFVLLRTKMRSILMRLRLSRHNFSAVFIEAESGRRLWTTTVEICQDIHTQAATRNSPVLFVLIPAAYQVDAELGRVYATASGFPWDSVDLEQPSRILAREFSTRELDFVDLLPVFRKAHGDGAEDLFGKVDTHFGPGGHRLVAETLVPVVWNMLGAGAQGSATAESPGEPGSWL